DGIVDNLVRKLIRRHPHVFPEGTLESRIDPDNRPTEAWIKESWERIKAEERAQKPAPDADALVSRLDGIARTLPAMARAEKLQRRAARHGFDWPDIGAVFDKLHEEIDELKEAWQAAEDGTGERDAVEDELGDLLFVCVNLARFMKVNPEQALKRTNRKFEMRFRAIEEILAAEGRDMDEESLEALDAIWQRVKGVEKG
ncbi:MAG TPA: nucleoside triphosphate pyrophosphohydrolase, partial [Marinobacter sp.]|nr:nucleoside triphosphate pyrophosphohydrolase [Marinobacter sp.]